MIPDHVTITQEPDKIYHWQIVKLSIGHIGTSREGFATIADAIAAARDIARCYRLPLAAELPIFMPAPSAEVPQ